MISEVSSPDLLSNVRSARARCQQFLDEEKVMKVKSAVDEEKKRRASELQELVSKRRRLEIYASAMELDANKAENKADVTGKKQCLTQSCCEQTSRNKGDGRRHC